MAIGITQELPGVIPESGVVPNAETAVKIAEAVLIPVYGKKRIASEEPFHAKLKNGEWHVTGTLPCPTQSCVGGVAYVTVAKLDGRISNMGHWK